MEMLHEKPSDDPAAQRASNELVKLIRKLRWMRMEEEAKKAENQLILTSRRRIVSSRGRARLTNTLRHRVFAATQRFVRSRAQTGSARRKLETTLMTPDRHRCNQSNSSH